jgi:hypothetical protein
VLEGGRVGADVIDPARVSRALAVTAMLLLAVVLSGCGNLRSWRMWTPETAGMVRIAERLYVEPAMTPAQVEDLRIQIDRGRARVEAFYGSVTTEPAIVACVTEVCSRRMGSLGDRAAAFGDFAIRLSHDGRAWPLIAHEWSHAEVYRRAGGWWVARRIPRWFDEGVATVVGDEARHSPENWQEIQRRGFAVPPMSELVTFAQWGEALRRYGETRRDDPDNLRIVYSAAAAQVRPWLACAGAKAVTELLQQLRDGEPFEVVHARAGSQCRP